MNTFTLEKLFELLKKHSLKITPMMVEDHFVLIEVRLEGFKNDILSELPSRGVTAEMLEAADKSSKEADRYWQDFAAELNRLLQSSPRQISPSPKAIFYWLQKWNLIRCVHRWEGCEQDYKDKMAKACAELYLLSQQTSKSPQPVEDGWKEFAPNTVVMQEGDLWAENKTAGDYLHPIPKDRWGHKNVLRIRRPLRKAQDGEGEWMTIEEDSWIESYHEVSEDGKKYRPKKPQPAVETGTPTYNPNLECPDGAVELAILQSWKSQTLEASSQIATMLGARWVDSCFEVINRRVPEVLAELAEAKQVLETCQTLLKQSTDRNVEYLKQADTLTTRLKSAEDAFNAIVAKGTLGWYDDQYKAITELRATITRLEGELADEKKDANTRFEEYRKELSVLRQQGRRLTVEAVVAVVKEQGWAFLIKDGNGEELTKALNSRLTPTWTPISSPPTEADGNKDGKVLWGWTRPTQASQAFPWNASFKDRQWEPDFWTHLSLPPLPETAKVDAKSPLDQAIFGSGYALTQRETDIAKHFWEKSIDSQKGQTS